MSNTIQQNKTLILTLGTLLVFFALLIVNNTEKAEGAVLVDSFVINPSSAAAGNRTATWDTSISGPATVCEIRAPGVTIRNGIMVGGSGNISVNVTITGTWSMGCWESSDISGAYNYVGGSSSVIVNTAVLPLLTANLTPDTDSIVLGSGTTLSWTSTNATSCRIDDITSGIAYTSLGASGSRSFSPIVDTDYRLVCSSTSDSSAPDTSTVFVTPEVDPVITAFTASQVVDYGNSSTITWEVTGPSSTVCSGSGTGWNGGVSVSGTSNGGLLFDNSAFTLTCSNGVGGSDVTMDATTFVRPLVSIWTTNLVSPLQYGVDTTDVYWNVLGPATTCTGSGFTSWNGPKTPGGGANQGPDTEGPFTTDTTLTLTCSNSNGDSGSDDVLIELYPRISSFSVTSPVVEGTESTHAWEVMGPGVVCVGDTLSGDDGGWSGGGKNSADAEQVGPITVDSVYRLTCTNGAGVSVQETRSVDVLSPNISIEAIPSQILKRRTSLIEWSTESITPGTCILTEPLGSLVLVVSDDGNYETVPIETQKTYTLTCDLLASSGGSIEASVTVSAFSPTFEEL